MAFALEDADSWTDPDPWTIYCRFCQERKAAMRVHWMPSQRRQMTSDIAGWYNCCRQCSETCFLPDKMLLQRLIGRLNQEVASVRSLGGIEKAFEAFSQVPGRRLLHDQFHDVAGQIGVKAVGQKNMVWCLKLLLGVHATQQFFTNVDTAHRGMEGFLTWLFRHKHPQAQPLVKALSKMLNTLHDIALQLPEVQSIKLPS